ncbi:MAG: RNA polymerase subunit sigma-54 [Salinibacter sp.]
MIAGVLLLLSSPSRAQREPGALGIGFQIGRPGGLALKFYRSGPIVYDGVISTDGDDYVAGHFHRLWEHPLPNSPLHFYLGPGLIVGPEGLQRSPRLRLGLSGEAGLNFYAERVEVFLHVTPTLRFLPDTRVGLDGNFGLRYYLPSF